MWPNRTGSVGTPSRGVLEGSATLDKSSASFVRLRDNRRNHALPRFIEAVTRAADAVQEQRPGARLVIGDFSPPHGGEALPEHASHRTGRDVDLLFYLKTLEGASFESPGFLPVGPDGLAWDGEHHRFVRFDVEREWMLIRTLLLDDAARVQWIFVHKNVRAILLEWAVARGEPAFLLSRAMDVLLQPHPGGPHDDHIHVRTECTDAEIATGCEVAGPARAWLPLLREDVAAQRNLNEETENEELAKQLILPIDSATRP